jgi:hypothetical protein
MAHVRKGDFVHLATYAHLIPGADVSFIDRLDEKPE